MCKPNGKLCYECRKPLEASTRPERVFCSRPCKDKHINRRKLRGAELYDLLMNIRFDRVAAKDAGLWALLCRMASEWNAEDKRAGAKSFAPVRDCKERTVRYGVRGRH